MGKTLKNILTVSLTIIVGAVPSVNYAAYIPLNTSLPSYSYIYSQDIDIQKMARIGLELQRQQEVAINTSRYIPLNGMPTYSSDTAQIANKIVKHTVQSWLDDDTLNLQLIKQAQKINEGLSAELPLGNNNGSGDLKKFKMRFRPVSTEAQIRYDGSFGANLSYNIAEATTKLQVSWNF